MLLFTEGEIWLWGKEEVNINLTLLRVFDGGVQRGRRGERQKAIISSSVGDVQNRARNPPVYYAELHYNIRTKEERDLLWPSSEKEEAQTR